MKHALFDMLVIQKMLESDELNYRKQKQLEKEKTRLLNYFREELHANNPIEVAIVRNFLQLKKEDKKYE